MSETAAENRIAAVRGFNRFYTRKLGVLEQNLLDVDEALGAAHDPETVKRLTGLQPAPAQNP